MPRIPGKTLLTGFHAENICLAKDICIQLQDKYSQKLYPVCPILQEVIGKEKPSIAKIPKTNLPLLDSIIKILVVFEGLMQLRPDLETVVWCVHSENFLEEWVKLIRNDLSALPQWLEKDFPDTSRNCKELVAELKLAELRYTMHSNSLVYFLPYDVEYGNWATFLEWQERKIENAKLQGLSEAIEINRLTCHYPAYAISVVRKIYNELYPLVKIISEKAKQSKRDKIEQSQILAGYLQKPAETEQEPKQIGPATRSKKDTTGITRIIDLVKQITDALTLFPLNKFSSEEYALIKRYEIYGEDSKAIEKLKQELSEISDTKDKAGVRKKIQPLNNRRKQFEKDCDPNSARKLYKEYQESKAKHARDILRPLQKELRNYLDPRWDELLKHTTEGYPLREKAEYFINAVFGKGKGNVTDKSKEVIDELECMKARMEYAQTQPPKAKVQSDKPGEPTDTEQKIEPAEEPKKEDWITVTEAATILSVDKGTISHWADERKVKDNGKKGRIRRINKVSVLLLKHKRESEDLVKDAADVLRDRASKIPDGH